MLGFRKKGPTQLFSHAADCKLVRINPDIEIPWSEVEPGHWVVECRFGKQHIHEMPDADRRARLDPPGPGHDAPRAAVRAPGYDRSGSHPAHPERSRRRGEPRVMREARAQPGPPTRALSDDPRLWARVRPDDPRRQKPAYQLPRADTEQTADEPCVASSQIQRFGGSGAAAKKRTP